MMKRILFTFFVLQFSATGINAGQIALSDSVISLGLVETNLTHTRIVTISNRSDLPVQIAKIVFEEDEFNAEFTGNQIDAFSSLEVAVHFNALQNIDYTDFMRIMVEDYNEPLIVRVEAQATFSDAYYDLSRNKWDEQLKSALHDIVKDHTELGYTPARDHMYGSIDNENGWVECVYTGRRAQFDDRTGANANSFNCEHTWPQGFFDQDEPMRSDIFHLFPTDVNANSQRGSYDFGVVQNTSWTEGGSKLGTDNTGLTVFEPRDVHKGNVARAHFYFYIRYSGQYIGYQDFGKMETIFRDWHLSDPVGSTEEQRNEAVFVLQNNRNPFIDHPEFSDRIIRFFGTENRIGEPEIASANERIELHNLSSQNDIEIAIGVINTGNANLNIDQITSSDAKFLVLTSGLSIAPESYDLVRVLYQPAGGEIADSSTIGIYSNDPDESLISIPLALNFTPTSVLNDDAAPLRTFGLGQNYPNPFNNTTTIIYELTESGPVNLSVFNLLGQEVAVLVNDVQPTGKYKTHWNATGQPSGIYFARLQAGQKSAIRQMILLQ